MSLPKLNRTLHNYIKAYINPICLLGSHIMAPTVFADV